MKFVLTVFVLVLLLGCTQVYVKEEPQQQLTGVRSASEISETIMETIVIRDSSSVYPKYLTVQKGTIVMWKNDDVNTHSLYTDLFLGRELKPGDIFSYEFSEVGEYEFFSKDFPGVNGIIIVE